MRVHGFLLVFTLVALQQFAVVLAQTNSNFDADACNALATEFNDAVGGSCSTDCIVDAVCKYYPLLIEAFADDGVCCSSPSTDDCAGARGSFEYSLDSILEAYGVSSCSRDTSSVSQSATMTGTGALMYATEHKPLLQFIQF